MARFSTWTRSVSQGFLIAIVSLSAFAKDDTRLLNERTPDQQPAMLLVGSGRLNNPGRDLFNTKVDDVLADQRQKETATVVEQLAAFKPTYIAVEWPSKSQAKLDALYRDYREGRYH